MSQPPGCISQGETKQAAATNINEAINLYLSSLEENGLPVPSEPEKGPNT